ncbi:hypothetical protein BO225_06715 [Dubosiella newyorkensis]|uniref:Uncharacterized protein n=1 Tax=Dubosiella newyorkensis TaxID=1862672 RepID=A0A1U7NM07_9FIRM|nr:hypothetical protein BO225_06715 [Dubosiella newyorkensis]
MNIHVTIRKQAHWIRFSRSFSTNAFRTDPAFSKALQTYEEKTLTKNEFKLSKNLTDFQYLAYFDKST